MRLRNRLLFQVEWQAGSARALADWTRGSGLLTREVSLSLTSCERRFLATAGKPGESLGVANLSNAKIPVPQSETVHRLLCFAVTSVPKLPYKENRMKKLQQLFMATVFTLVLTCVALAGDISTPGFAQPTPTPNPASASTSVEIRLDPKDSEHGYQLIEDIALELLRTILSGF